MGDGVVGDTPNVYVAGSLRNPDVPQVAQLIRQRGFNVFDDWFASGEKADEEWQKYEKGRHHNYVQALEGYHANDVFQFDLTHLNEADAFILVLPAGKSGYLELGYMVGRHKPTYVYVPDEPDRWDIMLKFADRVFYSLVDMLDQLEKDFHLHETPFDGHDELDPFTHQGYQDQEADVTQPGALKGPHPRILQLTQAEIDKAMRGIKNDPRAAEWQ